jgi:hypothetical protein
MSGEGNNFCGNAIVREDHPKIMDDLAAMLDSRGHKCVMIVGTQDHKFKWCQKDICKEVVVRQKSSEINKERHLFANELRQKGHTCVAYLESYPVQINWCGEEVCLDSQK